MKNTAWKTQGLCSEHPNPDLWFPSDARRRGTFEAAQQICAQCPVLACLEGERVARRLRDERSA